MPMGSQKEHTLLIETKKTAFCHACTNQKMYTKYGSKKEDKLKQVFFFFVFLFSFFKGGQHETKALLINMSRHI